MILDPNGGLVWFKPLPPNTAADRPAGSAVRGQTGAHVVAGRRHSPRLRAGRRRDRRRHLHGHRARARRQRPAGGPARVPAHPAGHRAGHGIRPDPVQPLVGRRAELRRRHRQPLPGDRHRDRAGDVRMDEHRSRRARRILRTGDSLEHRHAVRLLPSQLDQPRSRRQPADLEPQHLDRLRARRAHRSDRVAPRRQALELQDGRRHGHRVAARSARTVGRRRSACSTMAPRQRPTTSRARSSSASATRRGPRRSSRA